MTITTRTEAETFVQTRRSELMGILVEDRSRPEHIHAALVERILRDEAAGNAHILALLNEQAAALTPLPEGSGRDAAEAELAAAGGHRTLRSFGPELTDLGDDADDSVTHAEVWLDWAAQVRMLGFTWAQSLDIARIWYYG